MSKQTKFNNNLIEKNMSDSELENELVNLEKDTCIKNNRNRVNQVNQVIKHNYQRRIRPRIRNHITGKIDIYFASASLTFYHGKNGHLHCNECRFVEKYNDYQDVYHMIGGKVEFNDYDILYTAIREFVEETNMFMDKDLFKNYSNKYSPIENLSYKIYNQIKPKVKYYDMLVNPKTNLFHRCFIFNVNKFTDYELRKKILGLPQFYLKLLNPDIRQVKELNSVNWINTIKINPQVQQDYSKLLLDYFVNIDNFVYE